MSWFNKKKQKQLDYPTDMLASNIDNALKEHTSLLKFSSVELWGDINAFVKTAPDEELILLQKAAIAGYDELLKISKSLVLPKIIKKQIAWEDKLKKRELNKIKRTEEAIAHMKEHYPESLKEE